MEEFILYKLNRNPNYSLCFGKGKFIDFNIFNFINTNRVTTLNERMQKLCSKFNGINALNDKKMLKYFIKLNI